MLTTSAHKASNQKRRGSDQNRNTGSRERQSDFKKASNSKEWLTAEENSANKVWRQHQLIENRASTSVHRFCIPHPRCCSAPANNSSVFARASNRKIALLSPTKFGRCGRIRTDRGRLAPAITQTHRQKNQRQRDFKGAEPAIHTLHLSTCKKPVRKFEAMTETPDLHRYGYR